MTIKLPEPRYEVVDDNHKYSIRHSDGRIVGPLKSVTKTLEVRAKPALIGWAAREAAGYFKKEILRLGRGALDPAMLDQIAKDAAMAHRRKAKDAADLGTACHDAFEAIVKGREPENLPKELVSPVAAFKRYRLSSPIVIVATELAVASEEHMFGGRLDFLGYCEELGGWGIGDYKTSSGFYGNEYAYQVGGGYAIAAEEMYGIEVKWAEIARFSKKEPFESEARPIISIEKSKRGFLNSLAAGRDDEESLIGEPLFTSAGEEQAAPKKVAPKGKAQKPSPVGF